MMKNNRGTCFDSGSMSQENYSCSSPLLSKSTEFLLQNIFRVCMLLLLLLRRFSHVRLCATPETAAHQASSSLGFSRQEHWSGLPFPSPMHQSEK